MKNTLSLIVLFIIGGVGVPGCYNCNCPDLSTVNKYTDIEGIGSFISKKAIATSGLGAINANDKIRWGEIAYFSVGYVVRTYGVHFNQRKPSTYWGTAAYACDCVQPGYLGSQEKLKRLTVKTVFDLDAIYSAGNNVDELVEVVVMRDSKPLKEYLSKGSIPYDEYSRFDLVITKAPSAKGPFALDITVELDNGEVYTTRTPVIELI